MNRADIKLKSKSIVKPSMRKGNVINQIIGNRIRATIAKGQHKTSKMNQSKTAKNVFMKDELFC
jgi:hypothetical protein